MTNHTPIAQQMLASLRTCENGGTEAHRQVIAAAEMADMLVEAFKLRPEPLADALFGLMEQAALASKCPEAVIEALVTCVARADLMFQRAVEARAKLTEADPELAERVRVTTESVVHGSG